MDNSHELYQRNGISLTLLENIDRSLKSLLGINLNKITYDIKIAMAMNIFSDYEHLSISDENVKNSLFEYMSRYSNNIFNDLKKHGLDNDFDDEKKDVIQHFYQIINSIIIKNNEFLEDDLSIKSIDKSFDFK